MFDIFKKNEKKVESIEIQEVKEPVIEEVKKPIEFIWVDGYKATLENMQAIKGNFKYSIGEKYELPESIEPKLCATGFHFSKTIEETTIFFPLNFKNRIFKVKGLVSKEFNDNYGAYWYNNCFYNSCVVQKDAYSGGCGGSVYDHLQRVISIEINKLSAKEIEILEEISNEEYLELYKEKFESLETVEDFIYARDFGYINLQKSKLLNKMKEYGYSELFSLLIFDKLPLEESSSRSAFEEVPKVKSNNLSKLMIHMDAYEAEGLSKDMKIYLMLKLLE